MLTTQENLRAFEIMNQIKSLYSRNDELNERTKVLEEKMDHITSVTHPYAHVDPDTISDAKYDVLEPLVMMEEAIFNQYKSYVDEKDKILTNIKKLMRKEDILIDKKNKKGSNKTGQN